LDYVTKLSPKLCFVLCGVNDILKGRKVDEIVSDYENILFRLKSEEIRPVLLSTLFVTRRHPNASRLNERVKELNASLRRIALENELDYVDLNTSLSRDGYMMEDVSYDGLHPNGRGYVKIAEMVGDVLQKRLVPVDANAPIRRKQ